MLRITIVLVLLVFARCQYNYDEVLHKSILFYEAQRSGRLPANNRIPWRGDSALGDRGNNDEDLTGGWYDAGDHVKFGFPMASSVTNLAWGVIEYRDAYVSAGELNNVLDSIRWPLDYFLKCHVDISKYYGQVADGNVDHSFWGRAEDMTMPRPAWSVNDTAPGSDLAAETAAAMAASSIAFRQTDPDYSNNLLLNAIALYDFAYQFRGKYSDSIPNAAQFYNSGGYRDELAWGALWLHRATNDDSYLTLASEFYDAGLPWSFSWDLKDPGVQVLMYRATNDSQYAGHVEQFLRSWLPGGSVPYTPKGLAWRSQWGSLRYAANAALIALMAADLGVIPAEARAFARSQIHYALGDTGRSFVVGFGTNPPQRPHHRGASCPNPPANCSLAQRDSPDPSPQVLYGALVGGPGQNDEYVDDRRDHVKNEVTCDYNAAFQSAVAGLKALSAKK